MPPGISRTMYMPDRLHIVEHGPGNVSVHDLHMIDIEQQPEIRGTHPPHDGRRLLKIPYTASFVVYLVVDRLQQQRTPFRSKNGSILFGAVFNTPKLLFMRHPFHVVIGKNMTFPHPRAAACSTRFSAAQ